MNKFQTQVLKMAYKNYKDTNNTYYEFFINENKCKVGLKNDAEALMHYSHATGYLSESGYIEPKSNNTGAETMTVGSSPQNFDDWVVLKFNLTHKGIQYVEQNLLNEINT